MEILKLASGVLEAFESTPRIIREQEEFFTGILLLNSLNSVKTFRKNSNLILILTLPWTDILEDSHLLDLVRWGIVNYENCRSL